MTTVNTAITTTMSGSNNNSNSIIGIGMGSTIGNVIGIGSSIVDNKPERREFSCEYDGEFVSSYNDSNTIKTCCSLVILDGFA